MNVKRGIQRFTPAVGVLAMIACGFASVELASSPASARGNEEITGVGTPTFILAWQGAGKTRPEVPKSVEAPAGEEVVLEAHAKGTQIYACQVGADQKPAWELKAPEAELSDAARKVIVHHFAGPTWKRVDGSEVTGKVVAKQDAPKPDAIPWLLLTATSRSGQGLFSRVTSIQRIHTEGGLPPRREYLRFIRECEGGAEFLRGRLLLLRSRSKVRYRAEFIAGAAAVGISCCRETERLFDDG